MLKQTFITLCLSLTSMCSWAQKVWNNPYSFCDGEQINLKVSEVEFKQDETIIHMRVKGMPGGMICFPNYTVLKDQDGKKYAIKSAIPTRSDEDSCYVNQWVKVPQSSIGNYSLHFEPLPETTERFHFIESFDPNGFLVWNIHDSKSKTMPELFNSNWRDEQSGDWVLSLFNDYAIYNNNLCTYAEKSEKKIVINNGQEKTIIVIGKEKDGKRQFTINGKKCTLANFGSVLPNYPTEDNTAFNPENKKGEAVIVGWIKDFPKEISDKGCNISVKCNDIFSRSKLTISETTFDANGQFTAKVKLNGTQGVTFCETANDKNVFATEMVLQPGKQYYMMHDWKNGSCIFMGDDARLQNELLAFPCDYEWQPTGAMNVKVKAYDTFTGMKNDIFAKNPTLSKRYRDYINEKNRFYAAQNIANSREEIEASKVADKMAAIDPAMPLALTPTFFDYLDLNLRTNFSRAYEKYRETPELYLAFEKEGKIKLSDSEHELMKKWQQRNELRKKLRDCETRDEAMAINEQMEKTCSNKEINAFADREDIMKVYKEFSPKPYMIQNTVIDSLYSDQHLRDLCRTVILYQELTYNKELKEGYSSVLNAIKDSELKQKVIDLQNHYTELAKQNEEAVKKVIAPSSNVEGLTDGKAILEKLVEPYKGKIVYMDIWGTWCQPCVQAIKASPKMKEAVKDYDVVYLYFAIQSEDKAWKSSIAELGLTKPNYVHYNLPKQQQDAVTEYLAVDGVPFYVLFDKNGNMEKYNRGHVGNVEGFKKKIEELSKK